jgi:hypothetical protein
MTERQQLVRRERQRARYMIGPVRGTSLASVAAALKADQEINIVKEDPTLLVVEMTDEHAKELQARHTGRLIIERDAPLNPLDR